MLSSCHSHTWGLILPMQCVSAVQEGYTPAGHQILARKSCRCPRLSLPFSCNPARQKRPNPVHPISTHPSPNLPIKPAPCKMCHRIWCGDIQGPHCTHRAVATAAALSRLLFRLALGCGAGQDAAGAQQRAGGLPAADVRHQRGASAGNRGRDTVGMGAARPPLSPKGDGEEGMVPPMPPAQIQEKGRDAPWGWELKPTPALERILFPH